MAKNYLTKPEKLADAADTLFHQRGFGQVSIADVAEKAGVPVGNVYYYFKTRTDIVDAVIQKRASRFKKKLTSWESLETPLHSLLAFITHFEGLKKSRSQHGCPTGGLCQEANKIGGETAILARYPLQLSRDWLERQFQQGGFGKADAKTRALHILGGIQGSILLANTFADPSIITLETDRLCAWVKSQFP